jgi:hypothetical protein
VLLLALVSAFRFCFSLFLFPLGFRRSKSQCISLCICSCSGRKSKSLQSSGHLVAAHLLSRHSNCGGSWLLRGDAHARRGLPRGDPRKLLLSLT